MPVNISSPSVNLPLTPTTPADTFARASDAVGRNSVESGPNVKRTLSVKKGPLDFQNLEPWLLPPITDDTIPTYSEVLTQLNDWATAFPIDAVNTQYGTSVQARQLRVLRMFDDGVKPIVGVSVGIHGNEIFSLRGWIAAVDWLLNSSDPFALAIKSTFTVYFIPMFNPDASVLDQRNNANNVNLNRNWPYFFNSAPDADKGPAALSEPETNDFTTYMLAGGRAARVLAWMDIHSWESKDTFGFLTEQIHHTYDNVFYNRACFHYTNAFIKRQNYTAVNPPVIMTEYRSKRKPYIYTWAIQNGRPDCWGGILEFPEAESNSLNSSIAQDCFMGMMAAALHQLATPQTATIVEDGTLGSPLNSNPNLQSWFGAENRPSFYRGNKMRFEQFFDASLGRNSIRMIRPTQDLMPFTRGSAAYAVNYDTNDNAEIYIIAGRQTGVRVDTVMYHDQTIGDIDTAGASFPDNSVYPAAVHDGTDVYVSGGFTTVYIDNIYKSTGSGTSITWSTFLSSLVFFNGGLQRHTMENWSGLLIIAGGRDASSYSDKILAVDKSTGDIWRIGNLQTAKGWHVSAIRSNDLYVFGGWTGSATTAVVEKLALVDNRVGTGSDGAIVGVVPTNQFSSASYAFSVADVGRQLTVQNSPDRGEYSIASFIDVNNVTVTPSFTDGTVPTGLSFVISDNPPTASTTTSLPGPRRKHSCSFKDDIAMIFGGQSTSTVWEKTLYQYDMSTDSVSVINYVMDEDEDEEDGIITPIEEPFLAVPAMYYNVNDDTVIIMGGEDELGDERDIVYDIDLDLLIADTWGVEYNTYGWMRMNQVFNGTTGDQFLVTACLQNDSPITNFSGPYARFNIAIGPLGAPTRKVRTWYQVPATGQYETFVTPVRLEAGETEFRCYIRLYTAGTQIKVASFQLFEDRQQLTCPVALSETKVPDVHELTLAPNVPLAGSQFTLEGCFTPLVNVNVFHDDKPLMEFYNASSTLLMSLSFSSLTDGSANYGTLDNATFTFRNHITGFIENRTAFPVNHNRSSGKELRYDVVTWRLRRTNRFLFFELAFFGEVISYKIPVLGNESIDKVRVYNGIYSQITQTL